MPKHRVRIPTKRHLTWPVACLQLSCISHNSLDYGTFWQPPHIENGVLGESGKVREPAWNYCRPLVKTCCHWLCCLLKCIHKFIMHVIFCIALSTFLIRCSILASRVLLDSSNDPIVSSLSQGVKSTPRPLPTNTLEAPLDPDRILPVGSSVDCTLSSATNTGAARLRYDLDSEGAKDREGKDARGLRTRRSDIIGGYPDSSSATRSARGAFNSAFRYNGKTVSLA